ncbi:hypothetical protein FOMPIDRAFT_1050268 [Fomitopsis schrenkii]|uniref:CCHC-type domain-containing protein n=1 Tax=Fomitopsis schrenkii TaxID=2126942 RepID=S8FEK8_FOMSC|nr:hypothetical protein FOMPIDRAFT_1050268 [Fomitopsis schrenkii]
MTQLTSSQEVTPSPPRQTLADELREVGTDPDELRVGPSVFEGTGNLEEGQLPPAEEDPYRHGPPYHAATDINLAVKWGITDYGILAEYAGTTRLTRTNSAALKAQLEAAARRSDRGDVGITGASVPIVEPNGGDSGMEGASMAIGATRRRTNESQPEGGLVVQDESVEELFSTEALETDSEAIHLPKDENQERSRPISGAVVAVRRRRFSRDWSDMDQDDDTLGSLPDSWNVSGMWKNSEALSPILPELKPLGYSEFEELITSFHPEASILEYSPALDSDEEGEQLRQAVELSLQEHRMIVYEGMGESSQNVSSIHVNAVIHEISDNDESSHHDKPKPKDKGKSVDRDKAQRDFMRRFSMGPGDQQESTASHHKRAPKEELKLPKIEKSPKKAHEHKRAKATRFDREKSQVPDGGFFSRMALGHAGKGGSPPSPPHSNDGSEPDDPSSSESSSSDESSESSYDPSDSEGPPDSPPNSSSSSRSSSSSSSSSSTSRRRHHQSPSSRTYRRRHRADTRRLHSVISGIKLKPPFVWDGKPDLDLFDHWVYEIETWRELHNLDDRVSLKIVVNFMSDRASSFFMQHVAMDQRSWNMQLLYKGLFDYCFPPDYKERLRQRLQSSKQGKNQKEKGCSPERTPLDKMVKYAKRREDAYFLKQQEDRLFEGRVPGRTWGRFRNRVDGPQSYTPKEAGSSTRRSGVEVKGINLGKRNNNQARSSRAPPYASSYPKDKRPPKLSREERDRLRAEGKCFECKEAGHEARNCPQRKRAKAPHVQAGSVFFADIDRMAAEAQEADVHVGAVSITDTEYITALFRSHYGDDEAMQAGMKPSDRFSVIPLGDRFEVTDWLRPEQPILHQEKTGLLGRTMAPI